MLTSCLSLVGGGLKRNIGCQDQVQAICREGKLEDLLAQLAAHRLDTGSCENPRQRIAVFGL